METAEQLARVAKNPASVIGADIVITGNIEASFDLQIEGRVNGDVRCATLVLGEKSSIAGSVHAERVKVFGAVEGSIDTGELVIEAKGRVAGDVLYERLQVSKGGVMEGTLKRKAAEQGKAGGQGMAEKKGAETNKLTLVEQPASENQEHIYVE